MHVELILVPYDSGRRNRRMGAGPEALVERGVGRGLERAGHATSYTSIALPDDAWMSEIRSTFDLAAHVATAVREALRAGRFPLVLAGNCSVSQGIVAALGSRAAVLWFDAHGDFNTPDTSTSGFVDGMALATLTGRCWRQLATHIPHFEPLSDDSVWLVGARDLDAAEARALESSGIRRIAANAVHASTAARLRAAIDRARPLYLHLDLDVLDAGVGRANQFAAEDGVGEEELIGFLRALGRPAALAITAYDPRADTSGRVAEVAARAVDTVAASQL